MKPTLFVAAVLLGASGIAQVIPDADRLAQRRRPVRIVPRRGGNAPAPPPQPVSVAQEGEAPGAGGAQAEAAGRRCISACDRTSGDCMHRCPRTEERGCVRICLTANAECLRRCPQESVQNLIDGGEWRADPNTPVMRNVGP